MPERTLPDGTVVHDFSRVVLRRSKGKGGRMCLEVGNEFCVQELALGRVYDMNRFIEAWNNRTEARVVVYVQEAEHA